MRFQDCTVLKVGVLVLLVLAGGVLAPSLADSPQESPALYLHLSSNRYDINSMRTKLPPPPLEWQCIATVSIVSGHPFYFDIPCHYEPDMRMEGTVTRMGKRLETDFMIDVADVGPAYRHKQKTPINLNTVYEFGDADFRFCISDSPDPASTGTKK